MVNIIATTLLQQLLAAIQPVVATATTIAANPTKEVAVQQIGTLVVDAVPTLEQDAIAGGANLVLALDNLIKSHLAVTTATPSATPAA
jgi:hypothetical protein